MRTEGHISVAPAEVGTGEIPKHVIRRLEGGRTWAVASGIGRPRSWGYATRAALRGFERGIVEAEAKQGIDRLQVAFAQARRALVDACNALIEKDIPDAAFLALAFDGAAVHVVCVGGMRAYLHRGGQSRRMTPREESSAGLLEGQATVATERVDPEDLLMAGSSSAFSTRAVGRVAAVLQSDRRTPTAVLATLLTDPARKAGVGAAAVVLRVR